MSTQPIEQFLTQRIGLNPGSVGEDMIAQATRRRCAENGVDPANYERFLLAHPNEQKALIESVLVLETWFFRNHQAFDYLAEWARRDHANRPLRILSVPCATGEEPYSIAMTLLDAGFPPEAFRIDALDLSHEGLAVARAGRYHATAFRGQAHPGFRDRYFQLVDTTGGLSVYQIHPNVRNLVTFHHGNLLQVEWVEPDRRYDAIFCRNLLIYFTASAREQAVERLDRWLLPTGLLFLGHAERALVCDERRYELIRDSGVFACRRRSAPPEPRAKPAPAFRRESAAPPLRYVPPVTKPNRPRKPAAPPPPSLSRLEEARNLADQGELDQALSHCHAYLEQHPHDGEAHFLSGLIHQARERIPEAEQSFNRALYLRPDHLDALQHLTLIIEGRDGAEAASRLRQRLQRLRARG